MAKRGSERSISTRASSLLLPVFLLLWGAAQGCTEPTFAAADADSDPGGSEPKTDASAAVVVEGDATSMQADAEVAGDVPTTLTLDASEGTTPALDGVSPGAPDAGAPDGSRFTSDARVDAAPSSDAMAVNALPTWAVPLLGTYAKRSVTFSYDDAPPPPFNTRNVEHTIVRITQKGSELEFTSQLCSYVVSIKGAQGSPPLIFKNPAGMPPLTGRIVLGATNTFSSGPMLQHLGFDPARGNSCSAGRRPKFPDQTWLTAATCQCYGTTVPEQVDDCRVIDGDGDGKPGITAHAPSPLGTTVADYAMAFDYSIMILDGQVKANQLHELREVRAQQPSCINYASDGCSIGNNELCPGGFTRLLHVDDQTTCATLNTGDFGPLEPFPAALDCRAKSAP